MDEHPILFTTEMVKAILDGRKTQSRRIVKARKLHPDYGEPQWDEAFIDGTPPEPYLHVPFGIDLNRTVHRHYPKYQVGDALWVKEGYQVITDREPSDLCGLYLADDKTFEIGLTEREFGLFSKRKRKYSKTSGRFMYKSLARIFLEITNIRVERVQDISRDDAIVEGLTEFFWDDECAKIPHIAKDIAKGKRWWNHVIIKRGRKHSVWACPRKAFRELWDDINDKRGFGWDKNPWVWVIEWKQLPK